LFHEGGGMVDSFLDEPVNGSGKVRIGDHGLTLMRLIYTMKWRGKCFQMKKAGLYSFQIAP
jgi:hypothetical protein